MNIKRVASGILLATFLFNTPVHAQEWQNWRVTTEFHVIDGTHSRPHKGIDWAINLGTPIKSFTNGTVIRTVDFGNKGFGKAVYIKDNKNNTLIYAHLSKIIAKEGQRISTGDTLGLAGSTGRSTGSHLHFQVNIRGKEVDPVEYINNGNIQTKKFASREQLYQNIYTNFKHIYQ